MPISMYFGHLFSILSFLLTLIFVSAILRSKRPPGNTIAWLIFILLFPYIGIPLFLFLSDRKFQTRMQKKQVLYKPASDQLPKQEGAVEKILGDIGVPLPRLDQNARLIASGEEAYARIAELIESARYSVHLTAFIFADDTIGRELIALLEKKAGQGVVVNVLVDSFGSLGGRHPSFKELKRKGGKVAYFNPVFHISLRGRANFRNHRKLLIVDSQRAILGGMNIAEEYMGPIPNPLRWQDLGIVIDGSSVQDIQDIFKEDWKFATGEELANEQHAEQYNDGDSNLQVIASGPDVMGDPLYDTLISCIYRATQKIWIATPYFIPDESLTKALELAAKRGIEVHILVPGKSNHFLADIARGSYLRQLAGTGCHVSLSKHMMHAKAVIIDDFALLGSANFDMRSLILNYEVGILLRSGSPLTALEEWFQRRFLESDIFKPKVNYWRDLAEGVGRILGPFI